MSSPLCHWKLLQGTFLAFSWSECRPHQLQMFFHIISLLVIWLHWCSLAVQCEAGGLRFGTGSVEEL